MSAINISFDQGDPLLDWLGLTAAFEAGHKRPKAEIADTFLYRGKDTLLSRAAWIDGLGIAVKAATIFPDNPSSGRPMVIDIEIHSLRRQIVIFFFFFGLKTSFRLI